MADLDMSLPRRKALGDIRLLSPPATPERASSKDPAAARAPAARPPPELLTPPISGAKASATGPANNIAPASSPEVPSTGTSLDPSLTDSPSTPASPTPPTACSTKAKAAPNTPRLTLLTLPTEILLEILEVLLISPQPLTLSHDPFTHPPGVVPPHRPTRATIAAHAQTCPHTDLAWPPAPLTVADRRPGRRHGWGRPGCPAADLHALYCMAATPQLGIALSEPGIRSPVRVVRPRSRTALLAVCCALHGPARELLYARNRWVALNVHQLAAWAAAAPERVRMVRELEVLHVPPVAVAGRAWDVLAERGSLRRLMLEFKCVGRWEWERMTPREQAERREEVEGVDGNAPWEAVPGMAALLRLRGLQEVAIGGHEPYLVSRNGAWSQVAVSSHQGLGKLVKETLTLKD